MKSTNNADARLTALFDSMSKSIDDHDRRMALVIIAKLKNSRIIRSTMTIDQLYVTCQKEGSTTTTGEAT
jgi:uncharacterized protein YydD (DUF2326 family)